MAFCDGFLARMITFQAVVSQDTQAPQRENGIACGRCFASISGELAPRGVWAPQDCVVLAARAKREFVYLVALVNLGSGPLRWPGAINYAPIRLRICRCFRS